MYQSTIVTAGAADSARLERQVRRNVTRLFIVLAGGLLGLLVAALVWFSIDQDRRALQVSQRIASSAVHARLDFLSKTTGDYSVWDDAYGNVVLRPSSEWMDGNIGPFVFKSLNFEQSYVLDAAGNSLYGMIDGKVAARPDALAKLGPEARRLVQLVGSRAPGRPIATLVEVGGRPLMIGVGVIAPSTERHSFDPSRVRLLMFVDRLDQPVLAEMSRIYLLEGLRVSAPAANTLAASIPLEDLATKVIGHLTWDQPTPGREMLATMAPVLGLLALLVALAGSRMVRVIRVLTDRMLRDRNEAVEAAARTRLALAAAEAAQGDAAEARRLLTELETAQRELKGLRDAADAKRVARSV